MTGRIRKAADKPLCSYVPSTRPLGMHDPVCYDTITIVVTCTIAAAKVQRNYKLIQRLFQRILTEKVEKREELFNAAVKAVIEMGNCSFQQHLNQEQVNTIEAFLVFDGGDRNQLCVDIWNKTKPQVEYYWQDGTLSALEELRTKELYGQNYSYGHGRGM